MNAKLVEFLQIASLLQKNNIKVLLFGSLGLQQYMDENLNADDIDILLPRTYVLDKWDELKVHMEGMGYILEDLHEHQFSNGKYKVAFASIEDLTPFAGVEIEDIPTIREGDVEYFLLTLKQYLAVYTRSSKDSYRRNKNNDKDLLKIQLIKKYIA